MSNLQQFSELQTQLTMFLAPIKEIAVNDLDTSRNATTAFREIKAWEKKIDARAKELIEPLKMEIERIKNYAEQVKRPVVDAAQRITQEQIKFERILEEERRRKYEEERAAQRKREEEARQEQLRLQQEAEAKAKAMKEEAEMEAMFAAPDEAQEAQKRAEEEAARVKAAADAEAARIAFEAKKEHWDAKKDIKANKVAGTRRTWKFEIIDEALIPDEYKMKVVNEQKIKKAVTHMELRELPGVRIYEDIQITTR